MYDDYIPVWEEEDESYDEWDAHGFADERDYWTWKEGQ